MLSRCPFFVLSECFRSAIGQLSTRTRLSRSSCLRSQNVVVLVDSFSSFGGILLGNDYRGRNSCSGFQRQGKVPLFFDMFRHNITGMCGRARKLRTIWLNKMAENWALFSCRQGPLTENLSL